MCAWYLSGSVLTIWYIDSHLTLTVLLFSTFIEFIMMCSDEQSKPPLY